MKGNITIPVWCLLCAAPWLLGAPSPGRAQPLGLVQAQARAESRRVTLGSQHGRYVFGQVSDSDKDTFMLDTATGRLWRIAESGAVGLYLNAVPYRYKKGTFSPLPPEEPDAGDEGRTTD